MKLGNYIETLPAFHIVHHSAMKMQNTILVKVTLARQKPFYVL